MPMASREIIAAIGLLIFSALYAWATFYIPDRTIPNTPGPSFFPFVIITVVAILSFALLVKGIAGRRPDDAEPSQKTKTRLATMTMGAFFVYLALMPWAGFLLVSVVFFAVLMMFYGSRAPGKIVFWSLLVPIVLFVTFTEAFQILLPRGPLGF
jgi:putative tricarboxylic transport membrane protein